ncbi:MAG: DNA topoisomerase IV subunit A [Lentisphaerae bacterium]|nr:DNA topoisomerase IV subunit A [Lentisphaerota bacterium]
MASGKGKKKNKGLPADEGQELNADAFDDELAAASAADGDGDADADDSDERRDEKTRLDADNADAGHDLDAEDADAGHEDAEDDDDGAAGADDDEEDDGIRALLATNFIEYASYVVKDRAIPDVDDGLKPVQRRILYCLHRIDDGRYHEVAGVIGDTMHYHPHGDQSIGAALTVLANKEYFIDRQGNFGNILTGDGAAAARYIECRLTPLAREVLFNEDITEFSESYDGRSLEPVRLPCKVPALLMLGSDGIAVGMMTRIFPHNFRELLEAQIAILEDRPFQLYPDFQQGGIMDVSEYADGAGRIRLRARIEADGDKKVIIRELPATMTTESLIASIERAARNNRIKIAAINDYTAKEVAIEISLPRNVYAEETIRELYAYTDCEVTVNSTLRVIREQVPVEMTVSEVLRRNTEMLQGFLRRELEIERQKQEDLFHEKTLAQIFIENRIYKRIEKCETLELVMKETRAGLERFRHLLRRDITDADIEKLLQIPIRRISMFDIRKNEQELASLLQDMAATEANLAQIVTYTIAYIRRLLDKYGAQFPRRTVIENFAPVDVRKIARRDVKVYHDRLNHFLGTNVKGSNKDAAPLVCTEFDRLVLLRNDGACRVISVPEKEYIGPTKYVMLWDKDQIYSILYRDRQEGTWFVKRFAVEQFTLGREYQIVPPNCLIENLYTNSGVVVSLELAPNNRRSYHSVTVDFDTYALRSRGARGFKLTQYPVTAVNVIKRGSAAMPQENAADAGTDEEKARGEDETPVADVAATQSGSGKDAPASESAAKQSGKEPSPVESTAKQGGKDAPSAGSSTKQGGKEAPPADAAPKTKATRDDGDAQRGESGDNQAGTADEGEQAGDAGSAEQAKLDVEAIKKGAAKGMSRLRKLIDEDTPFFLED